MEAHDFELFRGPGRDIAPGPPGCLQSSITVSVRARRRMKPEPGAELAGGPALGFLKIAVDGGLLWQRKTFAESGADALPLPVEPEGFRVDPRTESGIGRDRIGGWQGRMLRRWKEAWRVPAFRREFPLTLLGVVVVLLAFSRFVHWVEGREGPVLRDPILSLLPPRDLTWPIFAMFYGSMVLAVPGLATRPMRLLRALQGYALMLLLRTLAMFVAPLDPPPGMIPLVDPVVRHLGPGAVLTRDLFFSGHTATLFLLFLASERGVFRVLLAALTAALAFCLLCQHVHYTVDVLSAPFFASGSYRLATLRDRRDVVAHDSRDTRLA